MCCKHVDAAAREAAKVRGEKQLQNLYASVEAPCRHADHLWSKAHVKKGGKDWATHSLTIKLA